MNLTNLDIAYVGEFSFEVASLGTVRCLSLTADHFLQANKRLDSSDVKSLDFVRWLLCEIARKPAEGCSEDEHAIEGFRLVPEQLRSVTDGDLEQFADKVIQKNRYLLTTHDSRDLEKAPDESFCDFLVRAFRHHATEEKAQWERMTESVSNSLFASATLKAMQRNIGLSDQLQDTIDKYTRDLSAPVPSLAAKNLDVLTSRMPEPPIQRNPIHETNEMLENVVKQMADLRPMAAQAAQLIRSMNDAALRMQADYIENAKTAGRQTRIAIWIAAVSLLVSAIGLAISSFFSYQSYVDAKVAGDRGDAQIKAFQSEIRDLATAHRREQAALANAIVSASRKSASAGKK